MGKNKERNKENKSKYNWNKFLKQLYEKYKFARKLNV